MGEGNWLQNHLDSLTLSEETEGYLLGRGATQEAIEHLHIVEWKPLREPSPNFEFTKRHGPRGEKLVGKITVPLYAPSGRLVGIEARSTHIKSVSEFRLPYAAWCPVMINSVEAAQRMWDGGSVWVVEGIFDLLALRMIVPPTDAVVATLRAGLSKINANFLARFCTSTVYMAYDNDETGRRATLGWVEDTGKRRTGALDMLSRRGVGVVDFRYRGKDPGDVWLSGGLDNLKRTFQGAIR